MGGFRDRRQRLHEYVNLYTGPWVFFRLLLPLLFVGAEPLLRQWEPRMKEALLAPVFLPFLMAVFNLYFSGRVRPKVRPRQNLREFARRLRNWHAFDGLGLFILMLFEAVSACGFSVGDPTGWVGLLLTIPCLYGPYAALSIASRENLFRCYEILAEDMMGEQTEATTGSV